MSLFFPLLEKMVSNWRIIGRYIAGEIISGRGHGIPVDYWSLGVLIYEMLSGSPPFRGDTTYKLFEVRERERERENWGLTNPKVILACQYRMPSLR